MNTIKTIWHFYISLLYTIYVGGHTDHEGNIYPSHLAKMSYELVYYMAFGAFLPSFPFVLLINEVFTRFGLYGWEYVGFLVYFIAAIAVGVSINERIKNIPKAKY